MEILVETLEEVMCCLGSELHEFEVLTKEKNKEDSLNEEPYCADKEIRMDFANGTELRIYVDKEGNLCVYSD